MAFYDLHKSERDQLVATIHDEIQKDISKGKDKSLVQYFSDEDTYIRKAAYLAIGRIYKVHIDMKQKTLQKLDRLFLSENEKVRQTVVNAAGEIGIVDFAPISHLMEKGLFDDHHSVRNAVIGSIKKMGEKNPKPVLAFAKRYLHHEDKEIRREICHGIELRGRKYPQDILPLLRELQDDKTKRVRSTLVHVLGQIAYKKGCLETVIADLRGWHNKGLVADALEEIIDVHDRYKNFAVKTQDEARGLYRKIFLSPFDYCIRAGMFFALACIGSFTMFALFSILVIVLILFQEALRYISYDELTYGAFATVFTAMPEGVEVHFSV